MKKSPHRKATMFKLSQIRKTQTSQLNSKGLVALALMIEDLSSAVHSRLQLRWKQKSLEVMYASTVSLSRRREISLTNPEGEENQFSRVTEMVCLGDITEAMGGTRIAYQHRSTKVALN